MSTAPRTSARAIGLGAREPEENGLSRAPVADGDRRCVYAGLIRVFHIQYTDHKSTLKRA